MLGNDNLDCHLMDIAWEQNTNICSLSHTKILSLMAQSLRIWYAVCIEEAEVKLQTWILVKGNVKTFVKSVKRIIDQP